jgi:acyl carrier protein
VRAQPLLQEPHGAQPGGVVTAARPPRKKGSKARRDQQGGYPMASTFDTVASIISSASDVPLEKIRPESHVMKDLEIDSLAFLDITFEIDKTFGIQLPVEDWMSEVNEGKRDGDDYFVLQKLCTQIDTIRAEAAA